MPPDDIMWWVIATLKGGVRKSTTAMLLAFALARSGEDVLVIDGDHGTQGVTDWASKVYAAGGELPFHVMQWAPSLGLLVPFAQKAQQETGARRVIVDVGGEAPEVLRQIILRARLVVSPVGPEDSELARIPATSAIAREARVPMYALLTRVPAPNKGIAREAREHLVSHGHKVLTSEIPQDRETYAHCWGHVPDDIGLYAPLADELRMLEKQA
jgi:cellulose biosynthesis protein BcsQ